MEYLLVLRMTVDETLHSPLVDKYMPKAGTSGIGGVGDDREKSSKYVLEYPPPSVAHPPYLPRIKIALPNYRAIGNASSFHVASLCSLETMSTYV